MIVEKCGVNGFVHVFVGAWPGKKLKEAVEAECFGRGRHAVFIDGGRRVHYHHVSDHVKLLIPYYGTNCVNADELEKRVHQKLLDSPVILLKTSNPRSKTPKAFRRNSRGSYIVESNWKMVVHCQITL
jgi:hypothetical protein